MSEALETMSGFVLEDGRRWGEVAHDFQRDDVTALSDRDGPRRTFLIRGRGMSKTTDLAGFALASLVADAPARSRSYAFAVDQDQAGLLLDALAGFVARTPGLAGAVEVGARQVSVRSSGASLTVMAADGASAFGLRPWLTVCDEVAAWPDTRNYRTLWSAIESGVPKVADGRLVVITTAGSPVGLGHKVFETAESSEHWRVLARPGPAPWWTEADVAATKAGLTEPEYRRLILCQWVAAEDALVDPEDVRACLRQRPRVLVPRQGVRYVAALDIGTRRDLTALAVAHSETVDRGRRTVVDLVRWWRPSEGRRVDLAEVQAEVQKVCHDYRAPLRFDRMQAEQMVQALIRSGVRTKEFAFNQQTTNDLARRLYVALRDRAIELPGDDEVTEQFVNTRLVENRPGFLKLDNPVGQHDDIPTAVGMCLVALQDDAPNRRVGGIYSQRGGQLVNLSTGQPVGRARRR